MHTMTTPENMTVPRFIGGGTIERAEKPVPAPAPGELLIRTGANALCGSERGQFFGGSSTTPGHEAAGVVVAGGSGTTVAPGSRGAAYLMQFCGSCRSCRLGFTNQCLDKRGDLGFNRDGGYGPYFVVQESCFFPVSGDVTATDATLLLDIMGTGGHALSRAELVHPDISSLYIAGAGPIGLGVLAMARLRYGADFPVYIADTIPYRLRLAETLGGLPINLHDGSPADGLRRQGRTACDVAVDTSGKEAARLAALNVLDKRGVLVCVGHGEGLPLNVSAHLIAPERAILGSEYFRFDELHPNLSLLRDNLPYLRQIITHRFPVSELQTAFETFWSGETGKVIVEP